MSEHGVAAESDGNELRPGPRAVKTTSPKGRLAKLEERETALAAELAAARAEASRLIDVVEQQRQALAGGEGTAVEVGRARRQADEYQVIVADIEAALAEVAEKRQVLASEIDQEQQQRERARQEKAAEPLREEADALVREFIDGMVGLCDPLVRHKALAEEVSFKLPLAKGVPTLTVDALARSLQAALDLGNNADGTTLGRSLVLRALAGPEDLPILRVPIPLDRLRELGVSEG
jgi:hypothetical protein